MEIKKELTEADMQPLVDLEIYELTERFRRIKMLINAIEDDELDSIEEIMNDIENEDYENVEELLDTANTVSVYLSEASELAEALTRDVDNIENTATNCIYED